jgi:hypothetical protein
MSKIRDLAISTIPFDRPGMYAHGQDPCLPGGKTAPPPECKATPPQCQQSHPECKASQPPDKPGQPGKEQKYVRGLPAHAVMQLRQQLQHHIGQP